MHLKASRKASDARIVSAKVCFCVCSVKRSARSRRSGLCVVLDVYGASESRVGFGVVRVCVGSVCGVFVPLMLLLGEQLFLLWAVKRPLGPRGTGTETISFRTA